MGVPELALKYKGGQGPVQVFVWHLECKGDSDNAEPRTKGTSQQRDEETEAQREIAYLSVLALGPAPGSV